MLKLFIKVTSLSILVLVFVFPASAATESSVTATVTPELVSVTLSDTSPPTVSYNTLNLGTVNAVPVSPTNDPTLTFVNTGTVEEDFFARGADATAAGSTWALSSLQGENLYVHKIAIPSNLLTMTKNADDTLLVNVLTPGGYIDTHLRLSMPTSITGSYVQHLTTVTVVAVKHT